MTFFTRVLIVSVAALLIAALAQPAVGAPPPNVPDELRAYSVLPPGQNGLFTISDVLAGTFPEHSRDQLDMYADLIDDDDVTEAELDTYFKSFQFQPDTIEREYSPTEGATVYRDGFGVPHIYADTDDAAFFSLGYVTAEDRLWQMDLLRHAGHGRLSELLGASYVETDKDLRRDGYTEAELQQIFDELDDLYGAAGAATQQGITQYTEGVNTRIAEIGTDPTVKPIEYQGAPIDPWNEIDTVAVVVLQLRRFGETAGAELRNAAFLKALRRGLGRKLAAKVFSDFVREEGPAPTSIPSSEGAFPSQDLGPVDPDAVAIPDNAIKIVSQMSSRQRRLERSLRKLQLNMPASNFIGVAPSQSQNEHSLLWGAPQVGYTIPQFFMEMDVHSPTLDFRGPAVPGASLLVPLGRGIDYTWSLTTGGSDAVDVRVEKLCGKNSYRFQGECVEMDVRTETITPSGAAAPTSFKVYRTVHGPVEARGTVNGKKVAIVRDRFFWKKEFGSVPFFHTINSNDMESIEEFAEAASGFTMSFNALYADVEHIGYWHVGNYPVRAAGVDPMLPSWGTGQWEFEGRFPFAQQPHVIDPAQGWIVNWNNKPSTGWGNQDASTWGPTHRVQLMIDEMTERTEGGQKMQLSDVVDVARVVATQDARALYIGGEMLELAGAQSGASKTATDALIAWIEAGAHRIDQNHDDLQDSGTAVALFDAWFEDLALRVFGDELGDAIEFRPVPVSDIPADNNGSSFYGDFSNYLYRVFAGNSGGMARPYCDDIETSTKESCSKVVRASLKATVAKLTKQLGGNPAEWTAPGDTISFDAVGAKELPLFPWQNRGTWNHAVEVLGRR